MNISVRLRWFRVTSSGAPDAEDLAILTDDERKRAERFTVDHPRRVFVAARAGLRRLLAHELNVDPASLEFSLGAHGKPRLEPTGDLHFNLSHSGETVVIAFARGSDVGVDVEELRSSVSTLRLARRFFTASEAAAVEAASGAMRLRTFFHCWTAKEAVLKATGSGLTVPVRDVEVAPDPDRPPQILAIGGDREAAGAWSLLRHEIAGEWIATVALRSTSAQLIAEEIEPGFSA